MPYQPVYDLPWEPVESSMMQAMRHHAETETLQVRFKNETVFEYSFVPREVYEEIKSAESVGKAFHHLIKTNPDLYPYTKVQVAA